ncbi:MAG: ComF family protein [Janthinobacterium lividum]
MLPTRPIGGASSPPAREVSERRSPCWQCLAQAPAFDATLALADYRYPLDSLVLALKFEGKLSIAAEFGRRLAERWRAAQAPLSQSSAAATVDPREAAPQLVLPVPLGAARLVERGYNQSWAIARTFARHAGLPSSARLLERRRETPSQMRATASERRANMHGAFAVGGGSACSRLRGAHLIVVDDVMTTGATLHAIAETLKQAGAARVSNVVALRTPLTPPY